MMSNHNDHCLQGGEGDWVTCGVCKSARSWKACGLHWERGGGKGPDGLPTWTLLQVCEVCRNRYRRVLDRHPSPTLDPTPGTGAAAAVPGKEMALTGRCSCASLGYSSIEPGAQRIPVTVGDVPCSPAENEGRAPSIAPEEQDALPYLLPKPLEGSTWLSLATVAFCMALLVYVLPAMRVVLRGFLRRIAKIMAAKAGSSNRSETKRFTASDLPDPYDVPIFFP